MSVWEKFRHALAESVGTKIQGKLVAQIEFATVKKVAADGKTCDVQMLTDADGVITEGISTEFCSNMAMKPKKGSKCLVAHIMNDDSEGLLVWCEEVTAITINGDELGGLTIAGNTAERIARLEQQMIVMCTAFDAHTHLVILPAPGTPSAPPIPLLSPIVPPQLLPPTVEAYLSNTKVKHGQG